MSNQNPKTTITSESSNTKNSESNKSFLNKESVDIEDQPHGTDSGFLSGPQSSFYEEDPEEQRQSYADRDIKENNLNKSTSANNKSSSHNPKTGQEQLHVIDSGCIEEYEEYDEPIVTNAKTEYQSIAPQSNHSREQHSVQDKIKYIRLQQEVETNIPEKFSNLSLQNESMNNLSASSKGSTADSVTTTAKKTESNQSPAWEKCYQQNDEGDTYLHLACISGHENVVAALIRLAIHPCLLSIKNDYGQTPLHLAALIKQRRILRMLLLAGAEPTIRDRHGNTALHLACMSGDEQCVNALTMPFSASEINEAHRQYGYRSNDKLVSSLSYACLPPDMEIRNYNGEFCVHIAAEAGYINILNILTQYGADINAKEGKGGYTPLHISIEKGNEELFKFLIDDCKHKLNLETETFGRLTAYQFACILKRSKMQSILENRGAEALTPPDSEYESSDDESDFEDSKNYDRFGDSNYFGNYKGSNAMAVM